MRCQLWLGSVRVVDTGRSKVAEVRSVLSQGVLDTLVKHGLSGTAAVNHPNNSSDKSRLSLTHWSELGLCKRCIIFILLYIIKIINQMEEGCLSDTGQSPRQTVQRCQINNQNQV